MPVDPQHADPSTVPGEPTIRLSVNGSQHSSRHSDSDRPAGAGAHPVVGQDHVTGNGETRSMRCSREPDIEPSQSIVDGDGLFLVAAGCRCGLDLAEVSGGGQGLGQRLLRCGSHTLTDVELVAVLLCGDRATGGALLMAELLLRAVGGIPGLTRTHPEALARLPGVGEAAAVRLLAALALPARRNRWGAVRVTELEELVPVFEPLLAGLRHERLAVAVCDRLGRVRAVRAVADGASDGAPLPVRDVIATVFRHDGHVFAIAHNHPSGILTPSAADRNATGQCRAAAAAAGLRFLGHLILGEHRTWNTA